MRDKKITLVASEALKAQYIQVFDVLGHDCELGPVDFLAS